LFANRKSFQYTKTVLSRIIAPYANISRKETL
jgi:hypothetical protein